MKFTERDPTLLPANSKDIEPAVQQNAAPNAANSPKCKINHLFFIAVNIIIIFKFFYINQLKFQRTYLILDK